MDSLNCKFCSNPARYYCSCVTPNINFCRDHRDTHEESPGNHNIRLHKAQALIPNPLVKNALIEKISQARNEAKEKVEGVLSSLNLLILRAQESFGSVLEKLNNFINICNGVIEEIDLMHSIPEKLVHCPLELILLSSDPDQIITKIKSPIITFNQETGLPRYTPSVFPHFLYNISDLSISIFGEHDIIVYPSKKEITLPSIVDRITFLSIGNNRILCTGCSFRDETGTSKCFILNVENVENEEIMEFPYLKYPRSCHSMTWLDRNPAVICGSNGDNVIKSVEMFKNDKWIEMAPINIARCGQTSVCTQQNAWVIGGTDGARSLDSIEKYGNNTWSVLKLRLNTPISFIGVCSLENNIILFGGLKSEEECMKNIFLIDINNLCITDLNQIETPSFFMHGSTCVDSEQISEGGYDIEVNPLLVTLIISQIYL